MTVKEMMLRVLVKKGKVLVSKSYYGNTYDVERTKYLNTLNIDYEKSDEPITDRDSRCVGTFQDAEYYSYLTANVVFENGGSANFVWEFDQEFELSEVINIILECI